MNQNENEFGVKWKVPEGACDCHHHIVDLENYAIDSSQNRKFRTALVEDYEEVQKQLGLMRNVIVAVSAYGYDNRNTLAALKKMGCENTRAILTLNDDVTDEELKYYHEIGVRGVRIWNRFPNSIDYMEKLAPRLAALGWHMCIMLRSPDDIVIYAPKFEKLPCQLVFDHMGFVPGIEHEAYHVITSFMKQGKAWVKISGIYYGDKAPDYKRNIALSRNFVEAAPDRVVWGTDWPHHGVNFDLLPAMTVGDGKQNRKAGVSDVNTAVLLDKLSEQVPDENTRRKILVENPAKLYGF